MWFFNIDHRKQRHFSSAEIKNLSWRDLAYKHAECRASVKSLTEAVAFREKRNTELKRPRHKELRELKSMLSVAQSNERRLQTEIGSRAFWESLPKIRSSESDGGNVVRFR